MSDDNAITQRILRTPECGLLTWDRVAQALSSACSGDRSFGNVLVVSAALNAIYRTDADVKSSVGPISRNAARAAWNAIATTLGPADPVSTDLMWRLMFAVFEVGP